MSLGTKSEVQEIQNPIQNLFEIVGIYVPVDETTRMTEDGKSKHKNRPPQRKQTEIQKNHLLEISRRRSTGSSEWTNH